MKLRVLFNYKVILFLLLPFCISCICEFSKVEEIYQKPEEDGKPPVSGGFIEIANNPEANNAQKHTIKLMMDFVSENDVEKAYLKILELNEISLSYDSLSEILKERELANKKYCSSTSIDYGDNHVTDLSPLSEFQNLKSIDLSENSVDSLVGLQDLKNLTSLNLKFNKIKSLESLKPLISLKILNLGYNSIENLEGIEQLSQLEELYLNNNKISNLRPLQNLKSLKILNLTKVDIKDWTPLIGLTNLEQLHIDSKNKDDVLVLNELVVNGLAIYTW